MGKMSLWLQVVIGVTTAVLLLLPLGLLFLRHPAVKEMLPSFLQKTQKEVKSPRYSAESQVSGYTLKLVDTSYLDYVAENLGIFGSQAIVDPRVYQGFPDLTLRHTVSHVRFLLVPIVTHPLFSVWGKDNLATRGDYRVEKDTLVVNVFVDPAQITGLLGKFFLEDAYLRTALSTMYYAHGLVNNRPNLRETLKIKSDIQDILHAGIMPWPIRIEQTRT